MSGEPLNTSRRCSSGAVLAFLFLKNPATTDKFYEVFARFFALTPIAIFLLFSIRHETKIIWAGPALIPLLPGIAFMLLAITEPITKINYWAQRTLVPFLVLTVAGFSIYFAYVGVGLPGAGYKASMNRLIGWEDLGRHIFEITKANNIDLVVGMDKHYTAAELGFYVKKAARSAGSSVPEIAGRPIVGLDGLMWHFWLPKSDISKKDAILVARGKSDLEFPEIQKYFQILEPVQEYRATANGKPAGRYFYRIVRNIAKN